MSDLWHPWFHRFCNAIYFDRVTVLNAERLPQPGAGPVLYLGLHRNGAVDGFVYHGLLPRAVFMLSAQLRRSVIGRMFFCGIEVVRDKDRTDAEANDRTNAEALSRCTDLLAGSGELFMFPEGTSSLGPAHLPFKSGAARLLNEHLASGRPITVVPLGIHYEQAWEFRSRVELVVGEPISTDLSGCATPLERLKQLKRRIQTGLEAVGVNVATIAHQAAIERFACGATLGTARSYFETLKAWEKAIPAPVAAAWARLGADLDARRVASYQGVPLYPLRSCWPYTLGLAAVAPVVGAAMIANIPPIVAGWWAGRRLADGRNVVSLWRQLIGLPVFMLWFVGVVTVLGVLGWWGGVAGYVALTGVGLKLYRPLKKLATTVYNAVRHPDLQARTLAFRALMLEELA